jgi:hypothetical protein
MSLTCKNKSKETLPFIILKNITCELKNNNNSSSTVARYLEIALGSRKYKNKAVNGAIYWDSPFKFYVEEEHLMVCTLIE